MPMLHAYVVYVCMPMYAYVCLPMPMLHAYCRGLNRYTGICVIYRVWVCGYGGMWVYEYVGMWVYGYMFI
jgi:hypothetical protein